VRYIDLHTHHPQINQISVEILSFNTSVESIKEIPHLFCNGIHPWDADKVACQNIEKKLMPFFLAEKFMGLGEIGLDKNSTIDFEIQKQVLAKQLEIL
jgi:TatD DNase family protein